MGIEFCYYTFNFVSWLFPGFTWCSMNPKIYAFPLALLILSFSPKVSAQGAPSQETVTDWYMEHMFQAVDRDVNDRVVHGELQPFSRELGWFLDEANFREADRDGSGAIDRREMRLFMGEAQALRAEQELLQLKVLNQKYPYFTDAKPQYFRRHPELVTQLLGNLVWVREHTETVVKILGQKSIIDDQPELIGALHRNLTFLAEHTAIAALFYEMKETKAFQQMDTWRTSHLSFVKNNAGIETNVYRIVFPRYDRPQPEPASQPLADASADSPASPSPTARLSPSSKPVPAAAPEIIDLGAVANLEKEIASLKETMQELQAVYAARQRQELEKADSLREANSRYTAQIRHMEMQMRTLRDSVKTPHAPTPVNNSSLVADLETQLRYLRTEAALARIEEDSLLAETIRQKKYIASLEKSLEEAGKTEVVADANEIALLNEENSRLRKEKQALNDSLTAQKHKQPEVVVQTVAADCPDVPTFEGEVAQLQGENEALADTLLLLRKEIARKERLHRDSLASNIAYQRSQVTVLETKIQEKDGRVWEYKLLAEERAEEINTLKQKQQELAAQLQQIQAENQAYQLSQKTEKDTINSKIEDLSRLTTHLKTALDSAEREIAANQAQMQAQAIAEARRIEAYQQQIEEISYDNDKLREQMEFTIEHSAENENSLEQQIILAKAEAEKLLTQNDRLKRRKRDIPVGREIITLTRELEDAESRISELLVKNQSLKYQLSSSFSYLDQTVAQQQQLETEIRSQLSNIARLSSLRDSLDHSVKEVSRVHWTDSMLVYRQRLNQAEAKLVEYQLTAQKEKAIEKMARDSLQNEILRINQEKKKLAAMEQVNIARINSIEARETELKQLEIRLEERSRLTEQRESYIKERMANLAVQEKKYQDLLEREKNLDLREQRIKQASGGN